MPSTCRSSTTAAVSGTVARERGCEACGSGPCSSARRSPWDPTRRAGPSCGCSSRCPGGGTARDPTRTTRILLADDHALVRRGVRLILDNEPDLTVVAEAGDGAEALELARTRDVDLAVLDIAL